MLALQLEKGEEGRGSRKACLGNKEGHVCMQHICRIIRDSITTYVRGTQSLKSQLLENLSVCVFF